MSFQAYEPGDINARLVAGIISFILVVLALSLMVLFFLFTSLKGGERHPGEPPLGVERGVPGPRLQVNPTHDWEQLQDLKGQLLQTYAWVDEERDIVRIPVTEAMTLYRQQGWQAMAEAEGLPGLRKRLQEWETLYENRERAQLEETPRRPRAGRQSLEDADPDARPAEGPPRETLGRRLERLQTEGGEP